MDARLEKALEFANYQITLTNQKDVLKEKFLGSLVYYEHKGKFTITVDLMSFCKLLIDSGNTTDIVLIDDNNAPVLVPDLQDFYNKILTKYFEETNDYYSKFARLSKKKTIEDVITDE